MAGSNRVSTLKPPPHPQVCQPLDYIRPATESELQSIVLAAAASGTRLKVVGAGHSFAPIAMTNLTLAANNSLTAAARMISLDLMAAIQSVQRHVDGNYSYVTVGAGIRLRDLNYEVG